MALHSTSERYRYIYGSNVRRLDSEAAYGEDIPELRPDRKRSVRSRRTEKKSRAKKPVNPEKEAAIQRNRARLLEFDWKYTIITAVALVLCVAAALVYVRGTVRLNDLSAQISVSNPRRRICSVSRMPCRQRSIRTSIWTRSEPLQRKNCIWCIRDRNR